MRFGKHGAGAVSLLLLALTACSDQLVTSPELNVRRIDGTRLGAPQFSMKGGNYPEPGEPCGTPLVADLKMGSTKVGTVKIQNEGDKLFVIYHPNSPYGRTGCEDS